MIFKSRKSAGKMLASKIKKRQLKFDIVLALPRGGIPVGCEIARELDLPLSVIVARKLGAPPNPEFAIGAICESNTSYYNQAAVSYYKIDQQVLNKLKRNAQKELKRNVRIFRPNQKLEKLINGKSVILVDDGIATGATAKAALKTLKKLNCKTINLAAPVCAPEAVFDLSDKVDKLICLCKPKNLQAIGAYYKDFGQISDKEAVRILQACAQN